MDLLRVDRGARESELAGARADREVKAGEYRALEHDLAGVAARLRSLEELDAARAEYGDGARLILAEGASNEVAQLGSVADYLDVDRRHERAVEACLGDLLQHVVVHTHEQAAAGLRFANANQAGRVGFVVIGESVAPLGVVEPPDVEVTALADVVQIAGPAAGAIRSAMGTAWIAPDLETAQRAAALTSAPVATLDGEVRRGPHVLQGGVRAEARGILTTKREIKELRDRAEEQRAGVERLREQIGALDVVIAAAESAIASMQAETHRQEKAVVGYELQADAARDASNRITRKQDQIAVERRTLEEEMRVQEARQDEARASIARIEAEQRDADAQLNQAQRRLFDAREVLQAQAGRTAEAKAAHAALVERAGALAAEVERLEEATRELAERITTRQEDHRRTTTRIAELREGIVISETRLDASLATFDDLRECVRTADETSVELRTRFTAHEGLIRDARRALETVRAEAAQLEVARATAESDLSHLAASCVEAVQASLDDVSAEVEQMERDGLLASPRPVDDAPEPAESDGEELAQSPEPETAAAGPGRSMTPDEMVADLRSKVERMGAVNMMAIDQFDDLESRHTFLTAQRKDLVDAIASTNEAIRRIDKTTKERFREAFAVINQNFEGTFATLFGGGRAGLTLLDENDQLESGIDIIAQPPGKRLQSVQLLSGGEKALTAMALMFAIFKYRPSPFCLLDEIDAPLDDANIGRFVEMLQGMQEHTQFILITHNRKTMEIADRLYGVTMEEPGVSKLISVQLN